MAWRGASCLRDQNQRLDWFVRSVGSCVQYVAVCIGEGDDRARTDGHDGAQPSPAVRWQLVVPYRMASGSEEDSVRSSAAGRPVPSLETGPRRAGRRDRRRGLPILGHLRRVSCTYSRIAWSEWACCIAGAWLALNGQIGRSILAKLDSAQGRRYSHLPLREGTRVSPVEKAEGSVVAWR